jgi:O-methyltransferase
MSASAPASLSDVQPEEAQTSGRSVEAPERRNSTTETRGLGADYLELLKKTLTATVHQDAYVGRGAAGPARGLPSWHPRRWGAELIGQALRRRHWVLAERCPHETLELGRTWPLIGETMIGVPRLDNLQTCIERVVQECVPGDLIETGVWRGGASIFMRGVLKALDVTDRQVWVADSFQGLPPPDGRFPDDDGDQHHLYSDLAVPLETVQGNFRRYGLLDEQVHFLPGWFRDTLPGLGQERWAIIRLDGDMYESTMDALEHLYPQLSPGGYVIVDDGSLASCRAAVDDFRGRYQIEDQIEWIDYTGFFWRRASGSP